MEISSLIEVFRMTELSAKTRCNLIIKLGNAINNSVGMNLTEPIVAELVNILDPKNYILTTPEFQKHFLS